MSKKISGNIVDLFDENIFFGEIEIDQKKIVSIKKTESSIKIQTAFIIPGFIDSHVHIESSMLAPSEFAKLAVVHGTVATVSDPHEIANVCGMEGVEFMVSNGNTVPFKFHFGAPSCVPATNFETAGAVLTSEEVDTLLQKKEIKYLSEMMNFPGVLMGDKEVLKKIASAKKYNKPIDGHAPGLRGQDALNYINAGISTDHECFTEAEALEKLKYGMKILIREGSAAKNFDALINLLNEFPDEIMFCSDDKHPDSLVEGHINLLCARAIAKGIDPLKVLKAACINPALHYKMDLGLLRVNDAADFVVVEDLINFRVLQTYIDGELVAENGKSFINGNVSQPINNFNCLEQSVKDFSIKHENENKILVIEALEGQLITNQLLVSPKIKAGEIVSDVDNDILKLVVINRYTKAPISKAFVKNFGLKQGAIASTVAHDSHNIIAVGIDDESICKAVNLVIKSKGGVSCVSSQTEMILALPIAGLMSSEDGYRVADSYIAIDKMAKNELGSTLEAPFMTLSFMALLVIPHIKLSDLGLFDGDHFKFFSKL
ncbi:MAG: adenine deaminase [Chitinophagia bacterium]|nr:adenine deaminase [Chitinophagia bacterium]